MFSNIYFLLTLVGLALASHSDLKKRIVSNKLNYGLIFLGIGLHVVEALMKNDFWILGITLMAVVGTFAIVYLFYRVGVFAGGDVKLFTAIAALNPVNYHTIGKFFGLEKIEVAGKMFSMAPVDLPLFALNVLLLSVFAIFPYGFGFCVFGLFKKKRIMGKLMASLKKSFFELLLFAVFAIASLKLFEIYEVPYFLILIPIIIFGALNFRVKLIVGIMVGLAGAYLKKLEFVFESLYLFFPLALMYGLIKIYWVARDNVLKKTIKITNAREGMISDEIIYREGTKIKRIENFGFKEFFGFLLKNDLEGLRKRLNPENVIVDRGAAGLEVEQIEKLKALVKKKKLENKIKIKESVAFVPAVFIGYLAASLLGDIIWRLF